MVFDASVAGRDLAAVARQCIGAGSHARQFVEFGSFLHDGNGDCILAMKTVDRFCKSVTGANTDG